MARAKKLKVKLQSVSFALTTIGLKVRISRDQMEIKDVADTFLGYMLDISIQPQVSKQKDVDGDDGEQMTFDGPIKFMAQCRQFTTTNEHYELTLRGDAPDDDALRGHWTRLPKKEARITYKQLRPIEDEAEEEGGES